MFYIFANYSGISDIIGSILQYRNPHLYELNVTYSMNSGNIHTIGGCDTQYYLFINVINELLNVWMDPSELM